MGFYRTDEKIFGGIALLWIVLWIAGAIGWVLNIVRIVAHIHDPLNTLMVFRLVGIFAAPLGAVLGYIS